MELDRFLSSELQEAISYKIEKMPETSLWMTVLIQGLNEFLKGPRSDIEGSSRWLKEAYWLLCRKDEEIIGSFLWICHSLNLDEYWVRDKILALYLKKNPPKRLPHMDNRTVLWR